MSYEPPLDDDIALGYDDEEELDEEFDEMTEIALERQGIEMQGLCTGHENPDLWFSESIDSDADNNRVNERSAEYKQRIVNVRTALSICNACPAKAECFAEGMRRENLDNGIWGGTLPGERILLADVSLTWNNRKSMINFAHRVRATTK